MVSRCILALFPTLVLFELATIASAEVTIIPRDQDDWICVDYALHYHAEHPDDTIVFTRSNSRFFHTRSHMAVCEVINNGTALKVYDGMMGMNYTLHDWYSDEGEYYHFWTDDESPAGHFNILRDNRAVVLSRYNATELQEYHLGRERMAGPWHDTNGTTPS